MAEFIEIKEVVVKPGDEIIFRDRNKPEGGSVVENNPVDITKDLKRAQRKAKWRRRIDRVKE